MSKTIVIGLDGAGFHLLDQWLNEADLPIMAHLMEDGAWQRLRSSYPPVTSPAWRCYSTGVNPGKHGVFWWEQFDRESYSITVPDSSSYNAKSIWDYLGTEGFTSAVVNMPSTYPPESINGRMISGGGFQDEYTSPPELQGKLEAEIGYENDIAVPKQTIRDDPERITEVNDLIDMRFEAAEYIRETYDPDFIHLTLFITNAIQHYVWGGEPLKRMWKCVDRNIGEFLEEDDNVIIMSDHGSMKINTIFHINTWLEREGYLKTKGNMSDVLYSLGIDKERLVAYTEKLGLKGVAQSLAPEKLVKRVPDSQGGVGRDSKEDKIDWEESVAFASGQGPIYILAEGTQRKRITSEIKSKLEEVTAPGGTVVARNVFDASDVYEGPYVDDGPDLVIDQSDGVHIPDVVGSAEVFVDPDNWKWESENHRDGIFIAHGPDIDDIGELDYQPTLYDLVPTILHWYGLNVPVDLDGDIIRQIFKDDSEPATRDTQYSEIDIHKNLHRGQTDADDEMLDRLKNLGYLSN